MSGKSVRISSDSPRGEGDLLRSLERSAEERSKNTQLMFQKDQKDRLEKKRLEQLQNKIVGGMMGLIIKSNAAIAGLESLKKLPLSPVHRQQLSHHMEIVVFYRESLTELMPMMKQLPSDSPLIAERSDHYLEENEKKLAYLTTVNQFMSSVRGTGFMNRSKRSKRGKRKQRETRKM
jgi:hypothetical protein